MIEGLAEELNNMKYKVGDRVKIRKDLLVGDYYDEWLLTEEMEKDIKSNDYILTISKAYIAYDEKTPVYHYEECDSRTDGTEWELTEAMIEGLVTELTDREKFEGWMRKLSKLDSKDDVWKALDRLTYLEADDAEDKEDFEKSLKLVADYLFGVEKKQMTKAEIEAELGYKIEIVEE